MKSHRAEKVADVVRGILARVLRENVRDPRIGFVTLTGVTMSPDLRHARVFFSFLGDGADREGSAAALAHAAPFLRRAVAREAGLRFAPELHFEEDPAIDRGFRVDALLREIEHDREQPSPSPQESDRGAETE